MNRVRASSGVKMGGILLALAVFASAFGRQEAQLREPEDVGDAAQEKKS